MKNKSKRGCLGSVLSLFLERPRPQMAAVILAGGNGSRFGGEMPKQFFSLSGIPILIRSLSAFDESDAVSEIVAVTREEDISYTEELCRAFGIRKLKCVVAGGGERSDSALAGFEAISENMKFVAFHDAARCLVTSDAIEAVADAAYQVGAASSAMSVYDTVKRVDKHGYVMETVDRSSLMAAATPQIFRSDMYRAAAYAARAEGAVVTDDNMLFERIGHAVKMVDTGMENFKITTRADILRAEAILRAREEGSKKP